MNKNIELSVIIPSYNEAENIRQLYELLIRVLKESGKTYEVIYVDDGSSDGSAGILKELKRQDEFLKIIIFRRNYGQTAAIDAGVKMALGKIIITMDGDLQNSPADILLLLSAIEKGYDVACGWRYDRKDSFLRNALSKCAYILRRTFLGDMIHDSGCTLKAFKRDCFIDLDLYGEMHRFIPAILLWKGFRIKEVKVSHTPRKRGKSKYSLTRVIKGFFDLLVLRFWVRYSTRPIHMFGGIGMVFMALGFCLGAYLSIMKFYFKVPLAGRPLLFLIVLLFIVGVQFVVFGLLADIITQTYYSSSGKRFYNIREIIG